MLGKASDLTSSIKSWFSSSSKSQQKVDEYESNTDVESDQVEEVDIPPRTPNTKVQLLLAQGAAMSSINLERRHIRQPTAARVESETNGQINFPS